MPQKMFVDVVDPSITIGHRNRYAVPASILAHSVLLILLVVVPLLGAGIIPALPAMSASVVLPPAAPEPPPPPASIKRIQTEELAPPSTNAAPVEAASVIGPERVDDISRDVDVLASLPGTVAGVPDRCHRPLHFRPPNW